MIPVHPLRIVVIDDNEDDVLLLREALEGLVGVELIASEPDGEAGLNYLDDCLRRQALPDLVLLDLNLPGRNGIEILRSLKANPSLKTIPVVLLSTSNLESDIQRALTHGAESYLSKPGRFDVLQHELQRLVSRFRTEEGEGAGSAWA
jgi:chemotaxis family two-component system response regulator Rcp1